MHASSVALPRWESRQMLDVDSGPVSASMQRRRRHPTMHACVHPSLDVASHLGAPSLPPPLAILHAARPPCRFHVSTLALVAAACMDACCLRHAHGMPAKCKCAIPHNRVMAFTTQFRAIFPFLQSGSGPRCMRSARPFKNHVPWQEHTLGSYQAPTGDHAAA